MLIVDKRIDELVAELKNKKVKINQTYLNNRIVSNQLNILSISDSKGLEFETVYVYMPDQNTDDPLAINKKYVAYTRALSSLTVLS